MIVQALTAAIEVAKKARMYAMSAAEKAAMDAFAIQATSQDIEGMHESIFDQSEMLQDRFDNTEDLGDEDWSQVGAWKEELAELSFRNYQLRYTPEQFGAGFIMRADCLFLCLALVQETSQRIPRAHGQGAHS